MFQLFISKYNVRQTKKLESSGNKNQKGKTVFIVHLIQKRYFPLQKYKVYEKIQ